jgi:hypothetical protein
MAKSEIFKWLEDEYRLILEGENSMRGGGLQREQREALDGDAVYKKFLQSERRINNKSFHNGQEVPEVQVSSDDVESEREQIQSKVEKLYNNCARLGNIFLKNNFIFL